MLQRVWITIRQNPGRMALALAMTLALVNSVLITTSFLNESTANELYFEVTDLTENLAQLRQVERDGLRGLEDEALLAEAELADLEAAFPSLGEPFDIYRQGFALAEVNRIKILAIETGPASLEHTPVGLFEVSNYHIHGVGQRSDCIGLLAALEQAGLSALALNQINLDAEAQSCSFDVVLASLGALPDEVDSDG